MKPSRRLIGVVAAGMLLAAGSVALVEAQTAETPPAAPTEAPPEEAPPEAVDLPSTTGMQPIPDNAGSNIQPSGPGAGQGPVRLELPPLRIIEPGVPIPPPPRTRQPIAIIQALDKVTAQTIRFAAPVGQAVRYENLIFTVRACEATTQNTAAPEAAAFLEILNQPRARAGYPTPPTRQIYRGWMFASSPGLHPLEHPVYDAWVIGCSTSAPRAATPPPSA